MVTLKTQQNLAVHDWNSRRHIFLKKNTTYETLIDEELRTPSLLKRLLQVHLQNNKEGVTSVQNSLKALYRRDKALFKSALKVLTTHAQEEVTHFAELQRDKPAEIPALEMVKRALKSRDKKFIGAIKPEYLPSIQRALVYKKRFARLEQLSLSIKIGMCAIL